MWVIGEELRKNIDEGFFRRQPGIDLAYERTTVFEHGFSLEFLGHDTDVAAVSGPVCRDSR